MNDFIYKMITKELTDCSKQLRHISKRKKLLKKLLLNDNLTFEQYNCAIAWLNHSDLTTEEILKNIEKC